jgi:hypothetical protein
VTRFKAMALGSLLGMVSLAALDRRTFAQAAADASAPRPSLSESLSGPAKESYQAAVALANSADCTHALFKYNEAYSLSKDPRLLFDIAICDRDLRAYAQMQSFLVRYEKEAAEQISPGEKADVDGALEAIRNLVGTVQLQVNEAGSDITVDTQRVGTTPLAAPLVLDLGEHVLTVKKKTFEPVERTIEVTGDSHVTIEIALVRQARLAMLRVVTDADAAILIDQKDLTRGSFDGAVSSGVHVVHVSEPGKKDYDTEVVLGDGEARTLDVTLQEKPHAAIWPWIAGGAAVLVGASIGGYFILRQPASSGAPTGSLFTTTVPP